MTGDERGSLEETAPGPATVPGSGTPASAPPAAHEPAPADDIEAVKQEIEQTREQLGETVEQLAAKADVKSRARAKVAELAGRVKGKTGQARQQAATRLSGARSQVSGKVTAARDKMPSSGGVRQSQLRARAVAAAAPLWQATPEPMRRTMGKGAGTAKQHRTPLAVAAGALVAVYLVASWWRRTHAVPRTRRRR